ncbi:hypothetical protein DC20_05300 [Rufibacter tibetensis]|uniref:Uncharacterized protein n=1 Tax=Rufibacter tibetensis TaxID=512763 RepID=A0A0P0CTF5_9BACT|nr:hypothetical protein DC20_05300 [Rufibacter tibetensis]
MARRSAAFVLCLTLYTHFIFEESKGLKITGGEKHLQENESSALSSEERKQASPYSEDTTFYLKNQLLTFYSTLLSGTRYVPKKRIESSKSISLIQGLIS